MIAYIFALLFVALCLVAIALRKSYAYVPLRELKRQARMGDPLAQTLYRAASYEGSLQIFLWIIIGLSAGASFVLFGKIAPWWLAFVSISLVVWLGFAWMPSTHLSGLAARIAVWATPPLVWLMRFIYVPLDRLAGRLQHRIATKHTGLYNQDDLHELLEQQKHQSDSRITREKLDLLIRVLRLDERHVGQVMRPLSKVHMVTANDSVSPILMNELHKTGATEFPVYNGDKTNVMGMALMTDLVRIKDGRSVEQVMRPDLVYVNEDAPLEQVLQAYAKTRQPLFLVVNSSHEVAGAISVVEVLEELFGRKIEGAFDSFYDSRAVAEDSLTQPEVAPEEKAEESTDQVEDLVIVEDAAEESQQLKASKSELTEEADQEVADDTKNQPELIAEESPSEVPEENVPKTDEEVVE